ncbi:MAG: ABC transporter permease [candidate division Zixibacteria bacterium]|nr:ABC transporter permease [candidate division Zixibacteria bacterium]
MIGHYLLTAWRNILASRSHAAINVIGFAIGMACCLVILLYIRDELSFDRHNTRGDRIYRVVTDRTARTPGVLGEFIGTRLPEVEEVLRIRATVGTWLFTTEEKQFYEQRVYWADGNLFDVFDVPLVRGNPKAALTAPNTMVISASMARKYFGDADPIGKTITGDHLFTFAITAIMEDPPPYAHYHPDFYVSIATTTGRGDPIRLLTNWANSQYYLYLLLPEGATPEEIGSVLRARIGDHLDAQLRSTAFTDTYDLQPLFDIHLHSRLELEMETNGDVSFIWMMTAIVILILLIACMNFTNLAVVRSITRSREIGMRKVAGAARGQIVRQFLGETILLSAVAFLVALAAVWVVLPFFRSMTGHVLSMPSLEPWTILGGAGIVAGAGLLAGAYPALLLSRINPAAIFRGASNTGAVMLRKALVVIQFAMAILLLIGTGTVYQQLEYMRNKHLGYDQENVVILPDIQGMDFRMIREEYPRHAGVVNVTGASYIPGRAAGRGRLPIFLVERVDDPALPVVDMQYIHTEGGFVETFGFELLRGRDVSFERDFIWVENPDGEGFGYSTGCILNEEAVRRLGWNSPDEAIDRFVKLVDNEMQVVGVVRDFHLRSLHERIEPVFITIGGSGYYAVRFVPGDPGETLRDLEAMWKASTPEIPFVYSFLDQDVERYYRSDNLLGRLVTMFAGLAVFTACLGLFGLAVFTAKQRTREVGIRKAMGASTRQLVTLLSREYTVLVVIANVIAWPVAYFVVQQWLRQYAYNTEVSLLLFPAAGLLGLLIAWITVSSQTLRAAAMNPVDALRREL